MNLNKLILAIGLGVLLTINFYKPQETIKTVCVAAEQYEFIELGYKTPPVKETSQADDKKENQPPKQEAPAYVNGDKMIIVFGATWCGPCKLLKQEFNKPSLTKVIKEKIKRHIEVDIDNPINNYEKMWINTIKPSTIPHTIFCIYEDGRWIVMKQTIGFMNEQTIIDIINNLG